MSNMLLTGDLGVKGDEERALLRALSGRGAAFLAAIKASTSLRSSSIAASMLMMGLLDCEELPKAPPEPLDGWLMAGCYVLDLPSPSLFKTTVERTGSSCGSDSQVVISG